MFWISTVNWGNLCPYLGCRSRLYLGQYIDNLSVFIPRGSFVSDQNNVLLAQVLKRYTRRELALQLDVDPRTITRWLSGEGIGRQAELAIKGLLSEQAVQTLPRRNADFTFIDLFAGIGGIRRAFENVGGECVFTSEWDAYANKTYTTNYPQQHTFNSDITTITTSDTSIQNQVPDHDVLLAGFPCQPFSIAGVSKKNSLGRAHGFDDETQGTLFFDLFKILKVKRPKAFLLENVKNLVSHDKGNTFRVIKKKLSEELGYQIDARVIDGAHFVPQHRERIIIVGFRDATAFSFDDIPLPPKGEHKLGDILHWCDGTEPYIEDDADKYFDHVSHKVHDKYTLSDKLWAYLQNYAAKHKEAGNGFGFGLVTEESVTRTLSARYYKDGSEILVSQGKKKNPRRLTPRECARVMGFPDDYKIPVSDTRAYKQFGNSVVVDVMHHVAKIMKPHITNASVSAVVAKKKRIKAV